MTSPALELEYCGERHAIEPSDTFVLGREADLVIDSNRFLHRRFLALSFAQVWWVHNIGRRLAATLGDDGGQVSTFVGPGASAPVIMRDMTLRFSAGPTMYEVGVRVVQAPFELGSARVDTNGTLTVSGMRLTHEQRLLMLALAEPRLRRGNTGPTAIPTAGEAAARLGWTTKKFERKLDYLCSRLDEVGVQGLRGEPGNAAFSRRGRLIEHALAVGLIRRDDLSLLDEVAVPTHSW